MEKVKSETRSKIIKQIQDLQATGFSIVDLITKFGEILLRSDIITAKQNVKDF